MCLCSVQRHDYALPRLLETHRKPPKSGHFFTQDTLEGTIGVRIIEVPLYAKDARTQARKHTRTQARIAGKGERFGT